MIFASDVMAINSIYSRGRSVEGGFVCIKIKLAWFICVS
jgi:hypothetical protein